MLVVIKGAGDLASGVAHRLKKSGFQVVMTEIEQPTVIRRPVAFANAVFEGKAEIEGVMGVKVETVEQAERELGRGNIPVIIDPAAHIIRKLRPEVVVDAIIAKKNTGTRMGDAGIVIALGPGFTAGKDAHAVVETKRGHYLGKVLYQGSAYPDTGKPGNIGGFTSERLIKSPCAGIFYGTKQIGDFVQAGDDVAFVGREKVTARISGVLRGLLKDGLEVTAGMKVGDIDPRAARDHCFTISDKSRAIAGGVLEAIMCIWNEKKRVNKSSLLEEVR